MNQKATSRDEPSSPRALDSTELKMNRKATSRDEPLSPRALDSTADSTALKMAQKSTSREEPFRFLDLPAELRVMVYENLIVRRHHQTWDGKTCSPTLVLTDSIAPVHQTCRFLRAEAGPFLRASIASAAVPRVILTYDKDDSTTSAMENAFLGPMHGAVAGLVHVIEIARKFHWVAETLRRFHRRQFFNPQSGFAEQHHNVVARFANRAAKYLYAIGL